MLTNGRDTLPIGTCERCGRDILAPQEVLVWAEDHTYHQVCYHALLEQRFDTAASG
jgi:hypothetical protein